MSRTLSKILVIMAMIVVFPLMIVGTAFAAYYSIDANLNVAVCTHITPEENPEGAYAKVVYGKETGTNLSISGSHLKKVDLKVIYNGYEFKGWFDGSYKEYLQLADSNPAFVYGEDQTEISFDITEHENLTAIFFLKEYNVSYNYQAQPNGEFITTTPEEDDGEATTKTYNYGDKLPELTYAGLDYQWKGWQIDGDTTNTIYKFATFDYSQPITLKAVWQENEKVNVKYYLNKTTDTTLAEDTLYEHENYEVRDPATLTTPVDGYQYSWQDVDGKVIEQVNDIVSDLNLYLATEEIVYTAVLDLKGATYNSLTDLRSSFTVGDPSSLEAWRDQTKYETAFSFHKVIGFKYDGIFYDINNSTEALASAIISKNPHPASDSEKEITVDVEIEKYFSEITVVEDVTGQVIGSGKSVYEKADLPTEASNGYGTPWSIGVGTVNDVSITINDLLDLSLTGGEVKKLYKEDGTAEGIEVQLTHLRIKIGPDTIDFAVSGDMTLNDLIEMIYTNFDNVTLSDTLTIDSLTVFFA